MKKNIDLVVCTGFRIHAVKRKHGGKRMNIKEVEKVTGISSQNIRFYEKSGLVHPVRNEENGYREYDTNDIRILKLIKMFRMIDILYFPASALTFSPAHSIAGAVCDSPTI